MATSPLRLLNGRRYTSNDNPNMRIKKQEINVTMTEQVYKNRGSDSEGEELRREESQYISTLRSCIGMALKSIVPKNMTTVRQVSQAISKSKANA